MKITQLIATKTPYHESVASRLPRGIKTQQQFLNLSYNVAVRDLGLSKAKSLNENFAAKLINSYHRQSLNEGVGSFLGKMAGNAVGGLGAAWKDAKAGYKAAKGSWDTTDPAAETPPTPGATPPTPGATPPTPGATSSAAGGGIGDIMKAIDKLDPASKKQLAGELDKSINTPPPTANTPAAPAAEPPPEVAPAADTPPEAAPAADTPKPPAATPNYGGGQTQSPAPSKVNYAGIPQPKPLPQATSAPGASNIKMNYSGMAAPKPAAAPAPAAPAAPQFKGPKVNGLQVRNMGEGRKLKFRSNFLGIDL